MAHNIPEPLGVMPSSFYWEKYGVNAASFRDRIRDLARAIHEYADSGNYKPIPFWIAELEQLLSIGRLV